MKKMADRLADHVQILAGTIGERNTSNSAQLKQAALYIRNFWKDKGFDVTSRQFETDGVTCENLIVEIRGKSKPEEIVLIGAHYDSAIGAAGANDNGSGVAALLEISDVLLRDQPARTIRFAAFPNEEPPYFLTDQMGSKLYADELALRKEKIVGMISLETMGYFSDSPKSQKYPPLYDLFYPSKGNFIAVVGNFNSVSLVNKIKAAFKKVSTFPIETVCAPDFVPGVSWSDHASFWKHGYRAVMVTDTAFYRYPDYHLATDTPDKLNYPALAEVTQAFISVIRTLADD